MGTVIHMQQANRLQRAHYLLHTASARFGTNRQNRTARLTPAGLVAAGTAAAEATAAAAEAPLRPLLPPLRPLVADARASSPCFLLPPARRTCGHEAKPKAGCQAQLTAPCLPLLVCLKPL